MRAFFSFIKEKWFISLMGVLAVSVLIWFVGPLIAIADYKPLSSEVVRLICIMVLLLLWGLNNLRVSRKVKKSSEALAENLTVDQSNHSSADNNELSIINARFNEALAALKKTSPTGKRNKNYLYELPWYMLIGPPGSGKTTALVNSGLEFPLENQFGKEAVKGVGGTRNCDWWFTDQSVIIDTAGRYTTQDSHATADAMAWNGFIDLLKKYRKRRPINGVIVVLSLQELMSQTDAELAGNVRAIRSRLQELTERLGVQFPVYLNFTKCDLVDGFNEYFHSLGKEERAQVWGMTFSATQSDNAAWESLFQQEFDLLVTRLHENLNGKIHQERNVQRRGKILQFPGAFESCRTVLQQFVGQTFSESRFHDQYLLRGVYFTSGTQDTNPLGQIINQYSHELGVKSHDSLGRPQPGRSFFVRNLLQQVIFPEAEMVSTNRNHERRMRWVQNGGVIAAIAAIIGGALLWSTSFGRNDLRLRDIEGATSVYLDELATLNPAALPRETLPLLRGLVDMNSIYNSDNNDWLLGLGLYQGDKINQQINTNHDYHIEQQFMSSIKQLLEQQLITHKDKPEYLNQALKAYLMLADEEHFDEKFLTVWFGLDWENRFHTQPETRDALKRYLDEVLDKPFQIMTLDEGLIETSRAILRRIPLHKQVYSAIKERAEEKFLETYRFDDALDYQINTVFKRADYEIPKLYTYEGYQEVYKPFKKQMIETLSDDNWVVGTRSGDLSEGDLATVQAKVEKSYLEDYIHHWQAAINQLKVNQFRSLSDNVAC